MRRIPIRMKLAAALMVPLLGLVFVTVIEVAETAADVDDVRGQTDLARASVGPSGVITSLQNERTWAVVELIGQETAVTPPVVGYEESRRVTDEAISEFRDTLQGHVAAGAYEEAMAGLDQLTELRQTIDANTGARDMSNVQPSNQIYDAYYGLIGPFLDANNRVVLAIDDAELRQATSLVVTTTRQLEVLSELARSGILEIIEPGGLDGRDEIANIAQLRSRFSEGNDTLLSAPAPFSEVIGPEFPEELVTAFTTEIDKALGGQPVELAAILDALNVPADAGYMGVRDELVKALEARADQLNAEAEARERVYIVVALVTLAAAITLTWAVSRSITRPLRSLTWQAKDMADHRLPDAVTDILETPLGDNISVPQVDPVRVRTRDEVSDVADALNTVQDTALDLAVEQAVLRRNIADSFVNLGRRNQNLLGRQLDFITELESRETDAETLSNLFRLDHLATRMRRNAESLLVLAGIDPPRQWAAPVRLTDVIRAALGEVEDYQRVTVRGVEPATIIGSAAADLAHLLAELIENALVFSPPDQSVDIRGRNREDGSYSLAVIDTGLGMAATDVASANRRLAGAESFTIAPSKYLGHYVAGNLAARHGIQVRLDTSRGQGVIATLTLPAHLLTTEAVTSAPVTPPHGHRVLPRPAAPGLRPAVDPSPGAGVPGAPSFPPMPAAPMAMPPADAAGPDDATRSFPLPSGHPMSSLARPQRRSEPARAAWAPTPPGEPPLAGGPRTTRVPDTGLGRTPGGLARRSPVNPDRATPAPADDRALLDALGRYAPAPPPTASPGRAPATPLAPAGPSGAPPPLPRRPDASSFGAPTSPIPPAPAAGSPGRPPLGGAPDGPAADGGLARRVPGAQLPDAGVVPLRRGDTGATPAVPGPAPSRNDPRPTPAGGASRATDVQTLLSSFTAGVQRGLDEARQRSARPTVDAGPTGANGNGVGRR